MIDPTDTTGNRKDGAAEAPAAKERSTRQRREILELFRRERRPLAPREVHGIVADRLPRIGIATVYRAIKRLADEGLIMPIEIPPLGTCYEAADAAPHHAHFVCTSCRRVFELERRGTGVETPPALPSGFALDDYELIVKGTCAGCGANSM